MLHALTGCDESQTFFFFFFFFFFLNRGKQQHGLKARSSQKLQMHLEHSIEYILKGVLHLLPKISMFYALSQNNQQAFEE